MKTGQQQQPQNSLLVWTTSMIKMMMMTMIPMIHAVPIDPPPFNIVTVYTGGSFSWDVPSALLLPPWSVVGANSNAISFTGGSVSVGNGLYVPQNVTSGVPFVIGQINLINPTATDGSGSFAVNLDIGLQFTFRSGTTPIDDIPVTFTETVNVIGGPNCVGNVPNCPDFIKITIPPAQQTINLTVPGLPSSTVFNYQIQILGMINIPNGGLAYDFSNPFTQLAAGEPSDGIQGVKQALIVGKLTGTGDPNSYGDPHFRTWTGENFDFHGECDLVFVHDPDFAHGLGLDIHSRTKIYRQWSYIDQIAIRIGDDILEIHGGMEDNLHWINGVANVELPSTLSGYQVIYHRANSKQREYQIKLDHDQSLIIKTFKDFVSINIHHGGSEDFGHSVGLTGLYGTGHRVGRDGTTIINDPLAFGQEWQVIPEVDGQLFRMVEGPQHPEQCKMPSAAQAQERRRRLGESKAKLHDAEVACEHIKNDETMFDNCVFDVLLTDDIEMAGAY